VKLAKLMACDPGVLWYEDTRDIDKGCAVSYSTSRWCQTDCRLCQNSTF